MVKPSIRARPESSGRPVALILGAGGIKGWAHAGAIRILHEAGVPIDVVVGASAGALIGPLYAADADPSAVGRVALGFTAADFAEWFLRGLRVSPDAGRMARRLWRAYGHRSFPQMALPFAAVALDAGTGTRLVLREGNVGRAVEASIRPPFFGRPARVDGHALLDGGMRSAVPVGVALEMGAAAVIAVNVGAPFRLPRPLRPLSARVGSAVRGRASRPEGVAGQLALMADLLSQGRAREPAPLVEVRPDMRGISAFRPWQAAEAVRRGEAAARRALPAIRRALASLRPA